MVVSERFSTPVVISADETTVIAQNFLIPNKDGKKKKTNSTAT
jgi:hypothetical protein